jgi:ABC-type multidrug transport system ATPase subunit
MKITLTQTGKRYNREWIFRCFDYTFRTGCSYAITGSNGSGKSTLLQVIAGATMASEGKVIFLDDEEKNIAEQDTNRQIAIATPYLELIEEMTAMELLDFHSQFKPLCASFPDILQQVGLSKAANKQIRYYSSGMKQRLKLAQAFFSEVPVLLLDEPTSNLDLAGIELYHHLISVYTKNKIVIVCSNDSNEYDFCEEKISVEKYKK